MSDNTFTQLNEVAARIKGTREIMGWSVAKMAKKTEVSEEQYRLYESGKADLPFSFIHKCALSFGIEITELLEGQGAHLSSYTVTRAGAGKETAKEEGITIQNLAHEFKHKIAEPYWVRYEYSPELQGKPIHLTKHSGQEFDLVISGTLKVQVGSNTEILHEGDSIYYNSSTPHGMIAIDGKDCVFVAVVLPGKETKEEKIRESIVSTRPQEKLLCGEFIETKEDEKGKLLDIRFKNTHRFNFAFDIVDALADKEPDKLAMIYVGDDKSERRFSFKDMKRESNRCANYLTQLGIQKGDKVMLILKRHYQFWFTMLALHKIGAVAIPATNQLKAHDLVYRFNSAGVKAIVCTQDDGIPEAVEAAAAVIIMEETFMPFNLSKLADPEYFQKNRLPAHSDHKYFADFNELANGQTKFIRSLSGIWYFAFASNLEFVPQNFQAEKHIFKWKDLASRITQIRLILGTVTK